MAENILIPLPGFELPLDLPWRIGFMRRMDDQLRSMRVMGHFLPPRFFGYYVQNNVPIGVAWNWTMSLDVDRTRFLLLDRLQRRTRGKYQITCGADQDPDFMLIHDRRNGACWLWSFEDGITFIQTLNPIRKDSGDEEKSDLSHPE